LEVPVKSDLRTVSSRNFTKNKVNSIIIKEMVTNQHQVLKSTSGVSEQKFKRKERKEKSQGSLSI